MNTLKDFIPHVISAFKKRNQRRLRKLNDRILKAAALEPNEINFALAVHSYILSKIVSKPRFISKENEDNLRKIESVLDSLANVMTGPDESTILPLFSKLEIAVASLEKEDLRFVVSLLNKGKLKMAVTFYAQGMSLGVAADLTGLEKQEILDYAGQTMMFDRLKEEKTMAARMKDARQFLSE